MSDVIVVRPLTDSKYALNVREEIAAKLQRAEQLKTIMRDINVNDQSESLELIRAAQEFNELTKEIMMLRRSLYIYGYKDDTCTLQNSYLLKVPVIMKVAGPSNAFSDEVLNHFVQVLAINTKSEFIKFNPGNQYFYKIGEGEIHNGLLINEHIIELFERGFGDITKFIILLVHNNTFNVYEIFTKQGKACSIKDLISIKDTSYM